jgi:ring-1,2-phenylacetyl-CoA epoxidase subunit PaaE
MSSTDTPTIDIETTFAPLAVTEIEHDTDDSIILTFEAPSGWRFDHGQHVILRRHFDNVEVRRSYSICSRAPDGPLRVSIKCVPGGVFSTWATNDLQVGERIDVMGPSGHFTHDLLPAKSQRYTMLAAGSGITPIISIVATVLEREPASTVSLIYVNRTSTSTMLLEDLEDLRDRFIGRLEIAYLFTREATEAELLSGRPDRERFDALIGAGLFPADVGHVFLCGPMDLIETASDALVAAGTDPIHIHRELFTADQLGSVRSVAPQEIDDTTATIATGTATLHGRDTSFTVYEGDSVLDLPGKARRGQRRHGGQLWPRTR